MKKIISLFLTVLLIITVSGCSAQTGAKWDGYDRMPFHKYLQKGFKGMLKDAKSDATVTVTKQEGWSEAEELDASSLPGGSTAVTYTAKLSLENSKLIFHFFMEENDLLTVKGASADQQGTVTRLNEAQAKELLEELDDYID